MLEFIWILCMILITCIVGLIIIEVFKWGYKKEKRGERTDWRGRPNNHLDMD